MSTLPLATATRDEIEHAGGEAFMAALKAMSESELESLFAGPNRIVVLDAIFAGMPGVFRPDRAGRTEATVGWAITNPAGEPDTYLMRIADGTCTVDRAPLDATAPPSVSLTLAAPDFIKVITKTGNPVMMFMTGRIKAAGDVPLAANIGSFFGTPGA